MRGFRRVIHIRQSSCRNAGNGAEHEVERAEIILAFYQKQPRYIFSSVTLYFLTRVSVNFCRSFGVRRWFWTKVQPLVILTSKPSFLPSVCEVRWSDHTIKQNTMRLLAVHNNQRLTSYTTMLIELNWLFFKMTTQFTPKNLYFAKSFDFLIKFTFFHSNSFILSDLLNPALRVISPRNELLEPK